MDNTQSRMQLINYLGNAGYSSQEIEDIFSSLYNIGRCNRPGLEIKQETVNSFEVTVRIADKSV